MMRNYITLPMHSPRVLGITGWSGAGKTTLLTRLIPLLVGRGLRVSTLKHAHHDFDVDVPGKDSHTHRQAGATEVIVASSRRWVQMHELAGEAEPTLAELLERLTPCDLVLVEGYKRERHPKLEVYRASVGKPPLHPQDPHVVAVATDGPLPGAGCPVIDLQDKQAVADAVLAHAMPLGEVLARLRRADPGTLSG